MPDQVPLQVNVILHFFSTMVIMSTLLMFMKVQNKMTHRFV